MTETALSDVQAAALSGATDADCAAVYPAIGEAAYHNTAARMLQRIMSLAKMPGNSLRVYKDGDLTFGVRPGKYYNGDSLITYAGATAQTLTDDATNYIYLAATGTLTKNTSGFPTPSVTPHIPLATVATASGVYLYTAITDCRDRAIFAIAGAAGNAEADAFFAATDITGAQAETLTDGSIADALHKHGVVEASTAGVGAPNVLTADESMKSLTNEGSAAKNYHTLPTAAANLEFEFIVQDADGLRVVAGAGDTIRIGNTVSAAAGYAEASSIGAALTLKAVNATEWFATSVVGTWTIA